MKMSWAKKHELIYLSLTVIFFIVSYLLISYLITLSGLKNLLIIIAVTLTILTPLSLIGIFFDKYLPFYRGNKAENKVKKQLSKFKGFRYKKNVDNSTFNDNIISDVDFVVIGSTGVWTVEVKSHKGLIGFDGVELTQDGHLFYEKDFLYQANGQAERVKKYLFKKFNKNINVQPVIVFANKNAKIHFGLNKINNTYVIGIDWLEKILNLQSNTILNADEVNQIYNELE